MYKHTKYNIFFYCIDLFFVMMRKLINKIVPFMTFVSIHVVSHCFQINVRELYGLWWNESYLCLMYDKKKYWINPRKGSKVLHGVSDVVPSSAHKIFFLRGGREFWPLNPLFLVCATGYTYIEKCVTRQMTKKRASGKHC